MNKVFPKYWGDGVYEKEGMHFIHCIIWCPSTVFLLPKKVDRSRLEK